MLEIDYALISSDVNNGFMSAYKFYKSLDIFVSVIATNIIFGLGMGIITVIIGVFIAEIKDLYLQFLSNLLFTIIGVVGTVLIFCLSYFRIQIFYLLPYTVKQMENRMEKAVENALKTDEEPAKPTKAKVHKKKKVVIIKKRK